MRWVRKALRLRLELAIAYGSKARRLMASLWRLKRLNSATKPDHYVLPNLMDFIANLSGKKIFSTIDLTKGYLQVKMDQKLIKKTAICMPFGTFKFLRLPFGDIPEADG